jgi:hypothetical protein
MLDPKLEKKLRTSSVQASVATIIGGVFVVGSLVMAFVKLNSLDTAIKASEKELAANEEQLGELQDELVVSKAELGDNQATLASVRADLKDTDARLADTSRKLEEAGDDLLGKTRQKEEVERQKAALEAQLQELDRNRAILEDEIRALEKQWQIASEQNSKRAEVIQALSDAAAQPIPLEAVIQPRAVALPIEGGKGYLFKLWIGVPEPRKVEVKQVIYYFNHPSFGEDKLLKSTDPVNNFEVQYKGYGAMDRVIVTVHDTAGNKHKLAFNMYGALEADGAKPLVGGPDIVRKTAPVKGGIPLVEKPVLRKRLK